VRQRHDLQPPQSGTATGTLVALGAARLGARG
jgi:pantoate--beta-alanine ligase